MGEVVKASSLRAPPVKGETYLVWTLRFDGDNSPWPVHLPGHFDPPSTNVHYHHDVRFFTEEQEAELSARWEPPFGSDTTPFYCRSSRLPDGLKHGLSYSKQPYYPSDFEARPELLPLVCRHSLPVWNVGQRDEHYPSHKKHGDLLRRGSNVVETRSGRLLCPHHHFDLTTWVRPGAAEVRCPLHGLLVRLKSE